MTRPMIGIFWLYQGHVFGKAVPISDGHESIPGIADMNENHADLWSCSELCGRPSSLAGVEYQEVPRGRVLYDKRSDRSIVYLDSTLMNPASRQLIGQFLSLKSGNTAWLRDQHYTTDRSELDALFDE